MNNPLRPFYFIVIVWGEQFRHYLTDYCIPSLLAPNNIPKLINNNTNKFLICTTHEDWNALQLHSVFTQLKKYVEPCHIEIPPPPPGVSGCQHMGIGHKLAMDRCFKDKAYGIALTPDLMISDGALFNIQKQALDGKHLVLCAAVRFAEEPFFAGLQRLGIKKNIPNQTELAPTSRQLVQLCLESFHSETETYDFNSRNYGETKAITLWRLPHEKGLLLHSLSWCPMLIDYGAMQNHDTSCLEQWTLDGDYIFKNLHDHEKMHICQDSDEMMLVSWSPLSYSTYPLKEPSKWRFQNTWFALRSRLFLLGTLKNRIFDPLKLKLFPLPVYWHTEDLDSTWQEYENAAAEILQNLPSATLYFLYRLVSFCSYYLKKIIQYSFITLLACCGNKTAKKQLMHRIHLFKQSFA